MADGHNADRENMKNIAPDLSILIPARNEIFLSLTVDNIIQNMRGNTEVIVVCDGDWPDPPVNDYESVHIIQHEQSIGQRAATNEAARISDAKYVMKVDAHCSFGEGFDVKMMADMRDDYTLVPTMYNLHAFDWVCPDGHRRYQSPSGPCTECGKPTERDILWRAKPSPETTAMRFDKDLRFNYWSQYKSRQQGDVVETMSLLGACWMCTRNKFWELGMCDEGHGSWGQMGTEVACKTWLSGGKLMVTRNTWFAHMFRTQGGDFGFPYPQSGNAVNRAREYSRDLWLGNNWDKAIHSLEWMIDKFAPIPDWHDKGIVYYTDNVLDSTIMDACQAQLRKSTNGLPIISASLQPIDFGVENIHLPLQRGPLTMFKQILAGLEAIDAEIVFFCEHDVLYHPSHFDFIPPEKDKFYYNTNVWRVRYEDGHAIRTDFCQQTSGLCAYKDLLVEHYRKRVEMVEQDGFTRKMGFEPGTHGRNERVDDYKSDSWESEYPNIDIRHDQTMTPSRWSPDQFRNQRYAKGWQEAETVPGWGQTKDRFLELLQEV